MLQTSHWCHMKEEGWEILVDTEKKICNFLCHKIWSQKMINFGNFLSIWNECSLTTKVLTPSLLIIMRKVAATVMALVAYERESEQFGSSRERVSSHCQAIIACQSNDDDNKVRYFGLPTEFCLQWLPGSESPDCPQKVERLFCSLWVSFCNFKRKVGANE
jgi:hypothetical protein